MARPKSPLRKAFERELAEAGRQRAHWKYVSDFRLREVEDLKTTMATFAERARVAEEGQKHALLHCDKLQNEKARYVKLYEYEAQKSKHLNRVIDGLQLFIEKFANTCALDAHPIWNATAKPD